MLLILLIVLVCNTLRTSIGHQLKNKKLNYRPRLGFLFGEGCILHYIQYNGSGVSCLGANLTLAFLLQVDSFCYFSRIIPVRLAHVIRIRMQKSCALYVPGSLYGSVRECKDCLGIQILDSNGSYISGQIGTRRVNAYKSHQRVHTSCCVTSWYLVCIINHHTTRTTSVSVYFQVLTSSASILAILRA